MWTKRSKNQKGPISNNLIYNLMEKKNLEKAEIARQSLENVKGGISDAERRCPRCGANSWIFTEFQKPGDPIKMECRKCGYVLTIPVINY